MNLNLEYFIYVLPGLLLAMVVHEVAHGYVAYLLGDNTAKNAGRLTLNPTKHIDPVGFISMLLFRFGWAKAVPFNPNNFEHRKRDTLLVAIAGPISNFILAIIIGALMVSGLIKSPVFLTMLNYALWYNIMLGVFNLLPFPPLDGSKVVASLLPGKYEYYFYKYERYFHFVLIILIFTNVIDQIMGPLIDMVSNFIFRIVLLFV